VRRSSSRAPPRPRRASTRPPPRFARAIADPTPTRRPSLLPPSSAPRASTDRLQVYPAGSPGVATDPHAEMGASLRSTPLRDPRARDAVPRAVNPARLSTRPSVPRNVFLW
jgi:hypothetical protein